MDSPRFRVSLLGGLSLHPLNDPDAAPVTRFGSRKTAGLLALLALSPGRSLTREVLIDRLWPDASLDDGRRSLRVALAALRRVLEPTGTPVGAVLIADRTAVCLRADAVTSDVADFETAVRHGDAAAARHLYAAGALLPAFYDDWAVGERQRLEVVHDRLPEGTRRVAVAVAEPPRDLLPDPLPTPPDLREGLPFYLTRYVGRETEREALAALWSDPANRLITVTGPGGVGKTRFVTECLATSARARTVRYVPLADASSTDGLVRRVAVALEQEPSEANTQSVGYALGTLGPARLVLDNLEQLIPSGAPDTLGRWLASCPDLQIVVTSRQKLGIPGEREFGLEPLASPTLPATPERLLDFASVRLFLDRARLARPDVNLSPQTAETVSRLCERLGGLPLALEITASWAGALTFKQMLSRVEAQLLDEAGPPTAQRRAARPDRHRSLRAALDVSLELLSPSLRQAFTDLAVFQGSFTGDAAHHVMGDEAGSLENLSRLRERSLLALDTNSGDVQTESVRFRLLPTVYEYAREIHEAGAARAETLAHAHAHYFLRQAEIPRTDQSVLDADTDNLRHALNTAGGMGDRADLCLCAALWTFWRARGHGPEGLEWLEAALLRHPDAPPDLLLEARHGAAAIAYKVCRWDDSRRHHEAALTLAREVGNPKAIGRALQGLGALYYYQDVDLSRAVALEYEAREQFRLAGDFTNESRILVTIGLSLRMQGDCTGAVKSQTEALEVALTTNDDECIAIAQKELAVTYLDMKRYDEAPPLLNEALARYRRIGNRVDIAYCLINLGVVAHLGNRLTECARYYDEAATVLKALGDLWGASQAVGNIGRLLTDEGDYARASAHIAEALDMRVVVGDKQLLLASVDATINLLVFVAASGSKPRLPFARDAVRLRAGHNTQWAALGLRAASVHDAVTPKWAMLRERLGASVVARMEAEGAALTLEEVVDLTRQLLRAVGQATKK